MSFDAILLQKIDPRGSSPVYRVSDSFLMGFDATPLQKIDYKDNKSTSLKKSCPKSIEKSMLTSHMSILFIE